MAENIHWTQCKWHGPWCSHWNLMNPNCLNRLPPDQFYHNRRNRPVTLHGWLYWIAGRSDHLHHPWRQLRLLKSAHTRRGQGQNDVDVPIRNVHIQYSFILLNKCTHYIPADIPFSGFQYKWCLVYIEDVSIFRTYFEEHLEQVDSILKVFQYSGFSLKLRECDLSFTVNYFGYAIHLGSFSIEDVQVNILVGLRNLRMITKLQ